ncbi:RusA family crossover junction endodeoxyribonuclease, partial [Chlorobium phaeovibrioides]
MVDIEFLVPGRPQALKRHRTGRFGNYDPSAVAKENFLLLALEHRPSAPLHEALQVAMQFRFSRPKAHFRGKNHELRDDAPYWHTGRPDVDNLAKF